MMVVCYTKADIGKLQVLKEDLKKMGKRSSSGTAEEEKIGSPKVEEVKSATKVPATPRSGPAGASGILHFIFSYHWSHRLTLMNHILLRE
jgi:hypothetical protein